MLMPESASNSAGTCAAISAMSPVILLTPAECPLPVETMVILSTFASGCRHGADNFRQAGDQLVDHGCLVVFLISLSLDVHGLGFGFTFLEDDVGFSFTLHAGGAGAAFSFGDQALLLAIGNVQHALLFDFRLLQHGGDQLILVARDFSFLHLGLLLFLNQLDLDLFSNDLLLLNVGWIS